METETQEILHQSVLRRPELRCDSLEKPQHGSFGPAKLLGHFKRPEGRGEESKKTSAREAIKRSRIPPKKILASTLALDAEALALQARQEMFTTLQVSNLRDFTECYAVTQGTAASYAAEW